MMVPTSELPIELFSTERTHYVKIFNEYCLFICLYKLNQKQQLGAVTIGNTM